MVIMPVKWNDFPIPISASYESKMVWKITSHPLSVYSPVLEEIFIRVVYGYSRPLKKKEKKLNSSNGVSALSLPQT